MKPRKNPIRSTIVYGALSAVCFIPLEFTLSMISGTINGFFIGIFIVLAGYAVLLARWSGRKMAVILLPLIILFGALFVMRSVRYYLFFAIVILAWIRSGACFDISGFRGFSSEFIAGFGGGFLVYLFNPGSEIGWSLSVFLFFLVQSLYFFVNGIEDDSTDPSESRFERAGREAEAILSSFL